MEAKRHEPNEGKGDETTEMNGHESTNDVETRSQMTRNETRTEYCTAWVRKSNAEKYMTHDMQCETVERVNIIIRPNKTIKRRPYRPYAGNLQHCYRKKLSNESLGLSTRSA